jgi:hypothetical protein
LLINERRIHLLHSRATALRHLRNGSRSSRNVFVAMCGATMLAALAACGSDNSTSPRTLATITLTPENPTIAAGGTQQFTAVGKDASGNVIAISPTWSVASGGGTIDENGLFTAGSTAGAFTNTVTATSGSVTATASVTVTSSTPSVVGDYALQLMNGKAPPDTVVNTPSAVIVFVDGALSLHSDASYKLLFHITNKTSSGTVADSTGEIGTYAVHGNTVVLYSSPTDSVVATSTSSTITLTNGGQVSVFSK